MEQEEIYTCVQGVAYPRIYTSDAAILFQDDKQRRYSVTVDYSLKKVMDEESAVRKVLDLGVTEPGVLLHYCESHELDGNNLDISRDWCSLTHSARSTSRKYAAESWIIMQSMYTEKTWMTI